jgi:hypothetical protein
MRMDIPSLTDISPTRGEHLDEANALKHFLGLDHNDAIKMFASHDVDQLHIFSSDFTFMGEKAMVYYLKAYMDYVLTLNPEDIEDAMIVISSALNVRYSM